MGRQSRRFSQMTLFFLLFSLCFGCHHVAVAEPATHNVISDLTNSIVQKLGWKPDDVTVSKIRSPDALIGHATLYEFDLEIGNTVIPLKLSEDVVSWQLLRDISPATDVEGGSELENSLSKQQGHLNPVLAPFQLAGPLELWIQDADNMRLSVPHDVEAGILRKVMLADGAVVTVKGARELDLRQPIQLPLPLSNNEEDGNMASSLVALALKLRHASKRADKPLSLRIVGPSSLVASSVSDADSTPVKLKVKRLEPGSVQLVSRQEAVSSPPITVESVSNSIQEPWMWPLPSLNGSNPKLRGFEDLLRAILGPNAHNQESVRLLRARAAAATFVKVEFELEKKLQKDELSSEMWPEWKTKPFVTRLQFELTAKLEGEKILPVNVRQIEPVKHAETVSVAESQGNVSMSKMPVFYLPASLMTL